MNDNRNERNQETIGKKDPQENIKSGEATEAESETGLVLKLQTGLRQLDKVFPGELPGAAALQVMVRQHRSSLRKKMWKELSVFWLLALIILAATTFLYVSNVYIIIVVQMLSIVIAVPLLFRLRKKGSAKT